MKADPLYPNPTPDPGWEVPTADLREWFKTIRRHVRHLTMVINSEPRVPAAYRDAMTAHQKLTLEAGRIAAKQPDDDEDY